MRSINCRVMCLVVLAGIVFSPCVSFGAEVIEWVVAMVNGQPILNGELQEAVTAMLLEAKREVSDTEAKQARDAVLDRMVEDRLLVAEAKNQGIDVADRELDVMVKRELNSIKSRYDSETVYKETLDQMGLSEDGLKANLREAILREYLMKGLIQRKVIAGIEITDADLAQFQKDHPKEYNEFEQVRLSHILVRCATDAKPEETRRCLEKAQALTARAKSGEIFADLAKQYSEHDTSKEEGGDLGFVKRGDVLPELEKAAFYMKPGDISDPVRSKLGYHVLFLTETRSPREYLISVKAKEKLQEYIAKLREKAHIEVFQDSGQPK